MARATVTNTLDQQYLAEIRDGIKEVVATMRAFNRLVTATQREVVRWREEVLRLREQVEACPICGNPVPGPSWREPENSQSNPVSRATEREATQAHERSD